MALEREAESIAAGTIPPGPVKISDETIISEFNKRLSDARKLSREWRGEAFELYDFVAGHQWDEADSERLKDLKRPMVTFNVAGKYLDAVTGLQINNRQEIVYAARQAGKVTADEILNSAVSWCRDECDADDEESDAFYDLILTGMGWAEFFVQPDDPDKKTCEERRDPLEMFWDPSSRKRNLADARWICRLIPYSKERAAEEFDISPEELQGLPEATATTQDGQPQIIPTPHDYPTEDGGTRGQDADLWIADYQWSCKEKAYDVMADGFPPKIFDADEWKVVEPMLQQSGRAYKAVEITRLRYYRAYLNGMKVLRKMVAAYQDGFTYRCMTGKRDRNANTWYALGRAIKDPQLWTNKFFSSLIQTLATNPKGGLMAERSSFVDQKKAEESWADPSSITVFEDGAVSGGRVAPKPPTVYPQGMDRLMQFSMDALPQTTGLNLEIMGLADREQAAILEQQRKQSAMAVIAWSFASMRRFHIGAGKIYADFIRQFMPDGTLVRVVRQDQEEFIPLAKDAMSTRYDIQVDDSPTSTNMKERAWATIERLVPALLKSGIKIPPSIIDYSPLPQSLIKEWKAVTTPDPKEQEFAQRMQMAEAALKEADVAKTQAEALLAKAKAQAEGAPTPDNSGAEAALRTMEMRFEALQNELERIKDMNLQASKNDSAERIAALQAAERVATAQASAAASMARADAAAADRKAASTERQASSADTARKTDALAAAMAKLAHAMEALRQPMKVTRDDQGNLQSLQ